MQEPTEPSPILPPNRSRHHLEFRALRLGLCPECGQGRIFAGAWKMNECCPVCGVKFERGPGYFTGAMYFSYALGIPIIAALTLLGKFWLLPKWPLHWLVLIAWLFFLPFVPWVFRVSRILFIHVDRYFDPAD